MYIYSLLIVIIIILMIKFFVDLQVRFPQFSKRVIILLN
jgi:hypothetical protein